MKKRILTVLAVVFVLSLLPVLLPFALTAEALGETGAGIPDFTMDIGAAARITVGDESGSDCGIRYSFSLTAEEYENLKNSTTFSDIRFGVFIAAASYNVAGKEIADETHVSGANAIYYWKVSETESGEDVYNVTPGDGMRRIICAEGDAMKIDEEGRARFYGSVVGMKDSNLRREYIGVGYVRYVENGETHYKFAVANDNVRTMEDIARADYEKQPSHRDQLVKIYLGKTSRDCTVVTAPTAKENLVATGESQELITEGVADKYSRMSYSLDGVTFSDEIPSATEAGKYTVYYKAASLTSVDRDSEVKFLTVEIAEPQTEVITLAPAVVKEKKEGGKVVGYSGTYDYKGLGEYKVGDTLVFKFKGQNIPNVGLFVNKNGVNPIGGGTENTGIFLQTSGHGAVTYNKRLYITGPYLVDAGEAKYYSSISGFSYREWLGSNHELGVDVSYNGGFSLFGIEMLDENTDYVYRITTSATGSAATVAIKFTLYSVADGSETLVAEVDKTITHFLPSLENRYAVVYGAGDFYSKNDNVNTGKSISFKVEIERPAESRKITLNCASITEKQENGKVVGYSGTYEYKGLGEYKVGDTLEFRFKGKNIPNVGLFVNKNGVNPIGGGTENTGIFLQTSGHGAETYDKRLYITGPYLVDAGGAEYYSAISGFSYRQWLDSNHELGVDTSYLVGDKKFSHFGIEMLDENTDYVYRITTSATGSAATVTIKCTLHSVTNGSETLVKEFTRTVTHYLDSLENRYAVAYGAGDFSQKTITFEWNLIKA